MKENEFEFQLPIGRCRYSHVQTRKGSNIEQQHNIHNTIYYFIGNIKINLNFILCLVLFKILF